MKRIALKDYLELSPEERLEKVRHARHLRLIKPLKEVKARVGKKSSGEPRKKKSKDPSADLAKLLKKMTGPEKEAFMKKLKGGN